MPQTDNEMKPNAELLRKVLEHIKQNPKSWDQNVWAQKLFTENGEHCGTAFCFAGHTCAIALGEEFKMRWVDGNYTSAFCVDPGLPQFKNLDHSYKKEVFIGDAAQTLLGLSDEQASRLFKMGNTLSDLERIVEKIITGEY